LSALGGLLSPLLDVLDHLCLLVDGDPEVAGDFYTANTPEEMVDLARESGILIDANDRTALDGGNGLLNNLNSNYN